MALAIIIIHGITLSIILVLLPGVLECTIIPGLAGAFRLDIARAGSAFGLVEVGGVLLATGVVIGMGIAVDIEEDMLPGLGQDIGLVNDRVAEIMYIVIGLMV